MSVYKRPRPKTAQKADRYKTKDGICDEQYLSINPMYHTLNTKSEYRKVTSSIDIMNEKDSTHQGIEVESARLSQTDSKNFDSTPKTKLQKVSKMRRKSMNLIKQKSIQQIRYIYAYNPSKLSEVTVEKKDLKNVFQHNTSYCGTNVKELGKVPVTSCMILWRANIKNEYEKIMRCFKMCDLNGFGEVGKSSEELTLKCAQKLESAELILASTQAVSWRQLCECLKSYMLRLNMLNSLLELLGSVKQEILSSLQQIDQLDLLNKVLKKVRSKKEQQINDVFNHYSSIKPQDNEIKQRILQGVSQIFNKISSQYNLILQIGEAVRDQFDKDDYSEAGYESLEKISSRFSTMAAKRKQFYEKIDQLDNKEEFKQQFQKRIKEYQKQFDSQIDLILQAEKGMINEILEAVREKMRETVVINSAVVEKRMKFSQLQKILQAIGKSFKREKIMEGEAIDRFLEETAPLISEMKEKSKELGHIRKRISEAAINHHVQELDIEELNKLWQVGSRYKTLLSSIIGHFNRLINNLSAQGSEIAIEEPFDVEQDQEIKYIKEIEQQLRLKKPLPISQPLTRELLKLSNPTQTQTLLKPSQTKKIAEIVGSVMSNLQQQKEQIQLIQTIIQDNPVQNVLGKLCIPKEKYQQISLALITFEQIKAVKRHDIHGHNQQIINSINSISNQDINNLLTQYFLSTISNLLETESIESVFGQFSFEPPTPATAQKYTRIKTNQTLFQSIKFASNKSKPISTYFTKVQQLFENFDFVQKLRQNDGSIYPTAEQIEQTNIDMFNSLLNVYSDEEQSIDRQYLLVPNPKQSGYQKFKYCEGIVNILIQPLDDLFRVLKNQYTTQSRYLEFITHSETLLRITQQPYFCLLDRQKLPIFISTNQDVCFEYVGLSLKNQHSIAHTEATLQNLKKWLKQQPLPPLPHTLLSKAADSTGNKQTQPRTNGDPDYIQDEIEQAQDVIQDMADEVQDEQKVIVSTPKKKDEPITRMSLYFVESIENLICHINNYMALKQPMAINDHSFIAIGLYLVIGVESKQVIDGAMNYLSSIGEEQEQLYNNNYFRQSLQEDSVWRDKTERFNSVVSILEKQTLSLADLNEINEKLMPPGDHVFILKHQGHIICHSESSPQETLTLCMSEIVSCIFGDKYEELDQGIIERYFQCQSDLVYNLVRVEELDVKKNQEYKKLLEDGQMNFESLQTSLITTLLELMLDCVWNSKSNIQEITRVQMEIAVKIGELKDAAVNSIQQQGDGLIFKYFEEDLIIKTIDKINAQAQDIIIQFKKMINRDWKSEEDVKREVKEVFNNELVMDNNQWEEIQKGMQVMIRDHEEVKRKQAEEIERIKRVEEEERVRKIKEEEERVRREREEEQRRQREERERIEREEQQRRQREQQKRLKEQQQRIAREQQQRRQQEQLERFEREEQQRRQRELLEQEEMSTLLIPDTQKIEDLEQILKQKQINKLIEGYKYNEEYSEVMETQGMEISMVMSEGFDVDQYRIIGGDADFDSIRRA